MAALWPGIVVEEANLTKNVWLLRRALGDSAGASPFIETVPKVGYRWVAPVRRGQQARPIEFPTAESPLPVARPAEAPTAELPPLAPSTEVRETPRSRHPAAVALAGAAVAAIVATGWIALVRRPRSNEATRGARAGPVQVRRSAAVVGFHDLSPREDSAWLSTALGEMIASELAAGERLRIVAAEDVTRQKLTAPAGVLPAESLEQLRRNLGADLVVSGAYATVPGKGGERLRLDVVVQDTRTGEPVGTASATGMQGDLFQLVSSLGASLRGKLGLAVATAAEQATVSTALPRDPEAARLYAEGLERQRLADAPGARPLLEQSIAREPDFALAHHVLSAALSGLGYQARARDEAKKAVDLDAGMSREERLNLEGRRHEVNHEADKAVETFRTLYDLLPGQSRVWPAPRSRPLGSRAPGGSAARSRRDPPPPGPSRDRSAHRLRGGHGAGVHGGLERRRRGGRSRGAGGGGARVPPTRRGRLAGTGIRTRFPGAAGREEGRGRGGRPPVLGRRRLERRGARREQSRQHLPLARRLSTRPSGSTGGRSRPFEASATRTASPWP